MLSRDKLSPGRPEPARGEKTVVTQFDDAAAPGVAWPTSLAQDHERELFLLRNVVIAGEIGAIAVPYTLLDLTLHAAPIALAIGSQILLNSFIWHRLRTGQRITERELCAQVLADILVLSVLLYFAGGTTNPFVDLYFVPLAFAAAALPWRYSLVVAVVTTTAHSVIGLYSEALAAPAIAARQGLWLTSIYLSDFLTAALIAYVVYQAAASLRRHERLLVDAREQELNNRRLVELGAMATGAAHELGSPLSTLAVLTRDLQHSYGHLPGLAGDLKIMAGQIEVCKETLSTMLASTGKQRAEGGGRVAVDAFLDGVLARWQKMRPGVRAAISCRGPQPAPQIVADLTLEQAIVNLLNNAADASPEDVELDASWDTERLRLCINDRGAGIDPQAAGQLGHPFFTTKARDRGRGLGLFLTATTVQRLGGRFSLGNRAEGRGACSEIVLPLQRIAIPGEVAHGHAA